jgi:hypothetical protein
MLKNPAPAAPYVRSGEAWKGAIRTDWEHILKFRNGTGKILVNALTPDFSGASDKILGYALKEPFRDAF